MLWPWDSRGQEPHPSYIVLPSLSHLSWLLSSVDPGFFHVAIDRKINQYLKVNVLLLSKSKYYISGAALPKEHGEPLPFMDHSTYSLLC